jgi:hypothetical protein
MMFSRSVSFYGDKFFTGGYGGIIYAYDIKTGKRLWEAAVDPEGLESVYPRSPIAITVVDGKVYARSQEHSMSQPYYRTWKYYCFNASDGSRIWDLNGAWSSASFSSGYMVAMNYFDGQIYCIGKGISATKVEVQNDVVQVGGKVLIKGSVVDVSPGTKSHMVSSRFVNGLPAVSDTCMGPWMEYVYMQKPAPANVEGVRVELYAIDQEGVTTYIGNVITDPLNGGIFEMLWAPPKEGKYTITAVFPGSKGYWNSYASTIIGVTAAPPAPTPATPEQVSSVQATVEALQQTIQTIQPLITALIIIVIICICLVAYDIHINRKMLKQVSK